MAAFTPEQERVNANSHFAAAGIGLIAVPILVVVAALSPTSGTADLPVVPVYGIRLIPVFGFAVLYRHFQRPAVKRRFESRAHIGIYFMMAGTYIPLIIAFAERRDQVWMLTGI